MAELMPAAVLHQQMPTDEIRQTRTLLEAIVSRHRATWSKLSPCEEITDLLKWCAILKRDAHQAGDDVVEANQFRGTVGPLHTEKDFGRVLIVMDGEVERALAGDVHFLGDVIATGRKRKSGAHAATTNQLPTHPVTI
jgi:hypothetical protein